jgi:hypothetical protein
LAGGKCGLTWLPWISSGIGHHVAVKGVMAPTQAIEHFVHKILGRQGRDFNPWAMLRSSKIFGIHLEILLLHGICVITYNYKNAMGKQNFQMNFGNFASPKHYP